MSLGPHTPSRRARAHARTPVIHDELARQHAEYLRRCGLDPHDALLDSYAADDLELDRLNGHGPPSAMRWT